MVLTETRRQFVLGALSTLVGACGPSAVSQSPLKPTAAAALAEIERKVGGRVGVYVLDTASRHELAHRADEVFALCSTFKWVLAAAILARVDQGQLSLDERIAYGPSELLEYAPVTRAQVASGSLTVDQLAQAAVTVSDNTAANLLLPKIGGPVGLTQFVRSVGDPVTRLDRPEPLLNDNEPNDPRDTTSPRAMVGLMNQVLLRPVLSPASREKLLGWLRSSDTGLKRLRAGLPPDWSVGDKTGTCSRGAVNDVAIALPPGRAPLLIAVYLSDSNSSLASLEAAHAEIGRLIADEF